MQHSCCALVRFIQHGGKRGCSWEGGPEAPAPILTCTTTTALFPRDYQPTMAAAATLPDSPEVDHTLDEDAVCARWHACISSVPCPTVVALWSTTTREGVSTDVGATTTTIHRMCGATNGRDLFPPPQEETERASTIRTPDNNREQWLMEQRCRQLQRLIVLREKAWAVERRTLQVCRTATDDDLCDMVPFLRNRTRSERWNEVWPKDTNCSLCSSIWFASPTPWSTN